MRHAARTLTTGCALLALIAGAAIALADDEAATPAPPPAAESTRDASPSPRTDSAEGTKESDAAGTSGASLGGSLDELLGLEEPNDDDQGASPGAGDVTDPSSAELERELTGAQARDRFISAVQQMDETATRLGELSDAGIVTQRLQEEILVKLELLIDHAEQEQQQQQSSSSSNSSQNDQQRRDGQQNQQQQPQQQQGESQQATGDPRSEAPPPDRQNEQLNPMIDTASAAWGALPDRVREALLQGLSDRFSTRYQQLTERYYRRLAGDDRDGDDQ